MKGKVTTLGAGLVLAAGLAVAAYAQTPSSDAGPSPTKTDAVRSKADMLAMANARFDRMDANRDGKIDAGDRQARTKARFAAIDSDKNGSISEAEFAQAHSGPAGGETRRHEGRRGMRHHGGGRGGPGMMLDMADANGDGAITRAEHMAAVESRFDMTDSNKDGQISRDERRAMQKMMREKHRSMIKG